MKHSRLRLLNIAFTSAWLACMAQPADSTEPQETTVEKRQTAPEAAGTSRTAEKRANANGAGAKVRVFIDPKTGQISRPPRNAVPAENLQKSVEESKEKTADLRETPSPRPGGGVMIDLKDHFRTPLTATRDAGGKLTIKHQSDSANSKENK